jgi:hypothetical protein
VIVFPGEPLAFRLEAYYLLSLRFYDDDKPEELIKSISDYLSVISVENHRHVTLGEMSVRDARNLYSSSLFTSLQGCGGLPMYNVKDCRYLVLDKALAETVKCRPPLDPYKTG